MHVKDTDSQGDKKLPRRGEKQTADIAKATPDATNATVGKLVSSFVEKTTNMSLKLTPSNPGSNSVERNAGAENQSEVAPGPMAVLNNHRSVLRIIFQSDIVTQRSGLADPQKSLEERSHFATVA